MHTPKDMQGRILAGQYKLVELVHRGPFCDTWSALSRGTDAPVAVKLLRPSLIGDSIAMERHQREVRLLAKWRHPNLFRVLDHGVSDSLPYVVSEYLPGRPLSDDISELSLSIDNVRSVGGQIARVLAAVHRRGVVHRGLSPDAVWLVQDEKSRFRVKVVDFGLARLTEDPSLTTAGQPLGRVEYLAPEYIDEGVLESRSDLYVLGLMVFEMLCGQPPFVGKGADVLRKHMSAPVPRPSELSTFDVPKWMDDLTVSLLQKEPDDRPMDGMTVAIAFRDRQWPPPA